MARVMERFGSNKFEESNSAVYDEITGFIARANGSKTTRQGKEVRKAPPQEPPPE
jgi:hypothetical protein